MRPFILIGGLFLSLPTLAQQLKPAVADPKPKAPVQAKPADEGHRPSQDAKPTFSAPDGPWSLLFQALKPREFGPTVMGGRIAQLAVYEKQPRQFYVASASGGLFKTLNGGITFQATFDQEQTVSLGAVTVSQSDPNLVWVGTGEVSSRNSVGWGDGVYKSSDGGTTWKNMGLRETRFIGRVLLDPKNADTIWVAALGQLWGPSTDRGIYKTTDGGKTWKKTLFVDERTGAVDVQMAPNNRNVLFASMWQRLRTPYSFKSGGPGSGLYKSTDGGQSWRKIIKGLPTTDKGRVGFCVSSKNPNRMFATIEAEKDGMGTYVSNDQGESWKKVNSLNPRPFYFSTSAIDPKDPDHLFVLGYEVHESKDGGKTFKSIAGQTHPDHHAIWISPEDPAQMLIGNDGGLFVTRDGGLKWEMINNLPIGQFYGVSVDTRRPYWVYGGLQDNNAWGFPTQGRKGAVGSWDGFTVAGGDGFYTAVDPSDPNTVYGSAQNLQVMRTDLKTGRSRFVRPNSKTDKLRFNWNAPYFISPHNSSTLYAGSQMVMKSIDKGNTWKAVSADLSTNDAAKIDQAEGPYSVLKSGAEFHCTITALAESPLKEGQLWAGTDDGRVHLSQDGGAKWTELTSNFPGLPKGTWCSRLTPSKHVDGRAYATFDGHRTADFKPYLFVTEDFGKTWKPMADAFPGEESLYVVREGDTNPDLLFVGSEMGLYISLDRGGKWQKFKQNFPTVAVHDLVIQSKEQDLVIATHGRGLFILDISALEQFRTEDTKGDPVVYRPQDVLMLGRIDELLWRGDREWVSQNTQPGTYIYYYLNSPEKDGVKVVISNIDGTKRREITGPGQKGLNRLLWRGFVEGATTPGEFKITLNAGAKQSSTLGRVVEAYLSN